MNISFTCLEVRIDSATSRSISVEATDIDVSDLLSQFNERDLLEHIEEKPAATLDEILEHFSNEDVLNAIGKEAIKDYLLKIK